MGKVFNDFVDRILQKIWGDTVTAEQPGGQGGRALATG